MDEASDYRLPELQYLRGVVDAVRWFLSDSLPGATELNISHVMRICKGNADPHQVRKLLNETQR